MTISEIIDGLEEIQHSKASAHYPNSITDKDVQRVCDLTKKLALHVQQLEVDMRHSISGGQ